MPIADSIVTTLFEGDYVLGVGALANSLWCAGFDGELVAGFRGDLTHWAAASRPTEDGAIYDAGEGCRVRFVRLHTEWHLTNRKPYFLLDAWPAQAEVSLFYFDPDIVNKARWSFYIEWAGYGLALVADPVMSPMPADHPFRMAWVKWLQSRGFLIHRWPSDYYNGGFVGFGTHRRRDVELWSRIHDGMAETVPMDRMAPVPRTDLFCMTDQDALNMLAMVTPGPLSTTGPEGMDFKPGGVLMSHAAGGEKPWRKRFVRSALQGVPPNLADKGWLTHCKGPIEVLPPEQLRRKARELRLAAAIGRLVRRA
jgi:hypothetical protein